MGHEQGLFGFHHPSHLRVDANVRNLGRGPNTQLSVKCCFVETLTRNRISQRSNLSVTDGREDTLSYRNSKDRLKKTKQDKWGYNCKHYKEAERDETDCNQTR